MTQNELCEKAGVSRATLAKIETGHYVPTVIIAKRLAEVLELDWRDIYMYIW